MARALARIAVLIAVLLMPFGMAPAAADQPHHLMASSMTEHCPDRAPGDGGKSPLTQCTVACSAALPASDYNPEQPRPRSATPAFAAFTRDLHGLHPETETPPPRRA